MLAIQANSLTKKYGDKTIIDDVTLNIPKGTIYGFLGLNGAGKTTTMRLILGMIKPTKGSVSILGNNIQTNKPWEKVGYLIESTYAYPNLTVEENLRVYFYYHRLKDKQVIEEIMKKLQLTKYRDVRAKNLSLGNKQRLGLAKALMHNPEILVLDEPVNGLDPSGIIEVRNLLKELSENGTTILISSHLLTEISKVADTIGIIHEGKLVKEIISSDLQHEIRKKLIIETSDNTKALKVISAEQIEGIVNTTNQIEIKEKKVVEHPERIAELLINNGVGLKELYTNKEHLEDYFLRIIYPYNYVTVL